MKTKLIAIVLGVVILLAGSCGPTQSAGAPGKSKTLEPGREALESGTVITIPAGEVRIVSLCVLRYQHVTGVHWHIEGNAQIDYWIEDSGGKRIDESGRTSSHDFISDVGLGEGQYYIYLSNEFDSTSAKDVSLRVDWLGGYLGK
jgi:hypothetical protein